MCNDPCRPHACTVPALLIRVAVPAKHHVFTIFASRREHRNGVGLSKSSQVIEVTILSVPVFDIAAAGPDRCRRKNRDAPRTHHLHQVLAPARKFLAIQCKTSGSESG